MVCYNSTSLDDKIAENFGWNKETGKGGFPPARIATIRALYDERHPKAKLLETYNDSQVNEITETIKNFIREERERIVREVNSKGTNLRSTYNELSSSLTSIERTNRINMIANMVMQVADSIERQYPGRTRKEVYSGFKENGRTIGGQFAILDSVYYSLMDRMAKYEALANDDSKSESDRALAKERAQKLRDTLNNWSALVVFVRNKLKNTEGIKLGNKLAFASYTNTDEFGDNYVEDLYDAENSTREHWQEVDVLRSAYGSIGKQVRRYLSVLPLYEIADEVDSTGKVKSTVKKVTDDLGFTVYMDPVDAHQRLLSLLRGISSSESILNRLAVRNKITGAWTPREAWLTPIVKAILQDPRFKTKLFVDFKKNFQPYTMMVEKIKNGLSTFRLKQLNKSEHNLGDSFIRRIKSGISLFSEGNTGREVYSPSSTLNNDASINWKNLKDTRALILEWLLPPKVEKNNSTPSNNIFAQQQQDRNKKRSVYYNGTKTRGEKRAFLVEVSRRLGIDLNADTADQIMKDAKSERYYTKMLLEIVTQGIDQVLSREQLDELINYNVSTSKQNSKLKHTGYLKLINEPFGKTKSTINEKFEHIFDTIAEKTHAYKIERTSRYKNRQGKGVTYYSDINPSYMGNMFDYISDYVKNNDKEGLKKFLEIEFLDSEFFKQGPIILNKWLEELYNACNSNEHLVDTFAGTFSYQRFLGSDQNVFEDFTSRKHILSMWEHFYSKQNKTGYSQYPVFIMGDSGASKYITAKHYNEEELLNGFYNVFKQECIRMSQVEAFETWLDEKGKTESGKPYSRLNPAFHEGKDKFTMLPFLNDMGITRNSTETEVKNAIKKYFEEKAIPKFKERMQAYGALETTDTGNGQRYTFISESATTSNIDQRIKNFYMNVKFATIQQLQMMTIDTSFYKSTEELQKRYKEIHAPGLAIDIMARDFADPSKLACPDGHETAIYYEDVKINAEISDPAFMQAIRHQFGDKNGKLSSKFNAYLESTLTDGQSYRTLKSLRTLETMSGEWDAAKENAYNRIMNIRAKGNLDASDIDELAKLAVVFQPKKSYLFTHERIDLGNNEVMFIPVQHKCAEAILIPELLPKGSKIRDLAEVMEEEGIDIAASTEVVKVGSFGYTKLNNFEQYSDDEVSSYTGNTNITNKDRLKYAVHLSYKHKLSYKDYLIQTNVPEHIHDSRLFGTQVRKLIMNGVIKYDKDGKYKENDFSRYIEGLSPNGKVVINGRGETVLNGRNLVALYNNLIAANILEDYEDVDRLFSNPSKLSEILAQATLSNDRDSQENILAYSLDEGGLFSLPLFDFGLEHDSAALLLSHFKKNVNKQKINGGSAVQVSAFGIEEYKEDGGLAFVAVDKDGNEIRSTDSDFKERKKDIVNIKYAEAVIPFDLRYRDASGEEHELSFSKYCNADGTLIVDTDGKSLLEKEFPGILDVIAYRIPTEREYSMLNLKVVRFTPKTSGGTIMVPAQGTTIAGFDFDIDKLYFMRKEFKQKASSKKKNKLKAIIKHLSAQDKVELENEEDSKLEWEEYDCTKAPSENTRVARNNMLIHLIRQRLMDEDTFKSRYTPQGFEESKTAALTIRHLTLTDPSKFTTNGIIDINKLSQLSSEGIKDPRPNYDPTDPDTIIIYNQQNQIADKLIGLFANQNTNAMFSSLMKSFKLKSPIEFAGHTADEGYGFDLLHSPEGIDSMGTLAEFLAASVDAVKEPVLNYLNFNTLTASSAALLARLGYSPLEIGLLFNQPIIKQVCEYAFNNNKTLKEAINEVSRPMLGDSRDAKLELGSQENVTSEQLADNIVKARLNSAIMENEEFKKKQLEVLALFSKISGAATELTDFIASTRFTAANSVGSTFGDLYAQQLRVRQYLEKISDSDSALFDMEVAEHIFNNQQYTDDEGVIRTPINDSSDNLGLTKEQYLDMIADNPFGFEQCMFDMNRKIIYKLAKYYPYETKLYSDMRARLSGLVSYGTLKAETINMAHNDLLCYLLALQDRSAFNGEAPSPIEGVTLREYFTTNRFIADVLEEYTNNPELQSHPFFSYLEVGETRDGSLYFYVPQVMGFKSAQKDDFKNAWASLLETHPSLARNFFMYNFYRAGNTFSFLSFNHLAPSVLKESIPVPTNDGQRRTYKEFLEEILRGEYSGLNIEDFMVEFILNHTDNNQLVYTPTGKIKNRLLKLASSNSGRPLESFEIDLSGKNNYLSNYVVLSSGKSSTAFKPAIKLGSDVYIAQSGESMFNVSASPKITYVRVNKELGKTNVFTHYFGDLNTIINDEEGNTNNNSIEDPSRNDSDPVISFDAAVDALAEEMVNVGLRRNKILAKRAILSKVNDRSKTIPELENIASELGIECEQGKKVKLIDDNGNLQWGCA